MALGTGTVTALQITSVTDGQIVNGQNPVWSLYGHERMGWALSVFNPATP